MNTIANYGVNAYTSNNSTNTKGMNGLGQSSMAKGQPKGVELELSKESLRLNKVNINNHKVDNTTALRPNQALDLLKETNMNKNTVEAKEHKETIINQLYQNPRISSQQVPNSPSSVGLNFDVRL